MTVTTPGRLDDLVRALAKLRPTDGQTRRRIAAQLGFVAPVLRAATPSAAEPVKEMPPPVIRPGPEKQPDIPESRPVVPVSDEGKTRSGAVGGSPLSTVLIPDRTRAPEPPPWLERALPFDPPSTEHSPMPAPEPLLLRRWARSVLSGALATLGDDGPLDVERAVMTLAHGKPLLDLPRQSRPTMARGIQILVDVSETMLPWAADQGWLVSHIRKVAGKEHVEVLEFDGLPTDGAGSDVRWEWAEYHLHHTPHAGATVVVVTDLGIGLRQGTARELRAAEWRAWATRVRAASCAPIAFVPYAQRRWPSRLDRVLPIVHLDRATSVRTVRRTLGRGLRPLRPLA